MMNLSRIADGAVVARDIDVRPPAALAREVRDAFPGAVVACASAAERVLRAGRRVAEGAVRAGSARPITGSTLPGPSVVATRSRGPSSEALLAAARPLDADFMPISAVGLG